MKKAELNTLAGVNARAFVRDALFQVSFVVLSTVVMIQGWRPLDSDHKQALCTWHGVFPL